MRVCAATMFLGSLWAVLRFVFLFIVPSSFPGFFSTLCFVGGYPNSSLSLPVLSLRGLGQQDLHSRVRPALGSVGRLGTQSCGQAGERGRAWVVSAFLVTTWLEGTADKKVPGTNVCDEGTRCWSLPNAEGLCYGEGGVVRSALLYHAVLGRFSAPQPSPHHPSSTLILSWGRTYTNFGRRHHHHHHHIHKAHPP